MTFKENKFIIILDIILQNLKFKVDLRNFKIGKKIPQSPVETTQY